MSLPTPQELRVMRRHRAENFNERRICRRAERLVLRLKEGENRVTGGGFERLTAYFIEDPRERTRAKKQGHFSVGSIRVVRKK